MALGFHKLCPILGFQCGQGSAFSGASKQGQEKQADNRPKLTGHRAPICLAFSLVGQSVRCRSQGVQSSKGFASILTGAFCSRAEDRLSKCASDRTSPLAESTETQSSDLHLGQPT